MVIIVLCFVFWASKGLEGLTSMHFFMSFALVLQFVQEIDMLSAGTKEVKKGVLNSLSFLSKVPKVSLNSRVLPQ